MRKISAIVVILFLFVLVLPGFGFDWGITVDNSSKLILPENADSDLEQRDRLSLWFDHFWDGRGLSSYRLLFNGYYLYTDETPLLIDVDRAEFQLKKGGLFSGDTSLDLSLGRLRYLDLSGFVLNHRADGASFALSLSEMTVYGSLGYTGLQLKPESGVNMSLADSADDLDDDVHFAPKRLFQQLRLVYPELLPGQKLSIETLFQQDLRSGIGNTLDSSHATARIDGGVASFFYSLAATGGWNHLAGSSALMLYANAKYFAEELLNSRFSIDFIRCGEEFLSISSPAFGSIYSPDESDMTRVQLSYSIRPWADSFEPLLRNLQFQSSGRIFSSTAQEYEGTELDLAVLFRPSHDLGASITGGFWLPEQGDSETMLRLELSLSL